MKIDQALLDGVPEGAVLLERGSTAAFNQGARTWFPALAVGRPAPEELRELAQGEYSAGTVELEGRTCLYSRIGLEEPLGTLILLRAGRELSLSDLQMEGVLRQLREQMSDIQSNLHLLTGRLDAAGLSFLDAVNQRFYQMLRLVGNIEILRDGQTEFRPVTIDLAGFLRQLTAEVAPLLREAGITLHFQSDSISLLINGDALLLRKMILGLVSNSAQAARKGWVNLQLSRMGERAVLSVTDSGAISSRRQLALLLTGEGSPPVPAPGERAGLGLPVVRRVVELHKGSLLIRRREAGGLEVTVALPAGPLEGGLSVKAPAMEWGGGFSPLLVELADVLPARVFRDEEAS